jgi:hypothetical protein
LLALIFFGIIARFAMDGGPSKDVNLIRYQRVSWVISNSFFSNIYSLNC